MTRLAPILGVLALAAVMPADAASVTTYHNSLQRLGAYRIERLTLAAAAGVHRDTEFNASVSGHVYAQPLYWQPEGSKNGLIIVATESTASLRSTRRRARWCGRTSFPRPCRWRSFPAATSIPWASRARR